MKNNKTKKLSVTWETITCHSRESLGRGMDIFYGINETPFGKVLIAVSDKGVTDLRFIATSEEEVIQKLHKRWPKANITRDDAKTAAIINDVFCLNPLKSPIKLHIVGTYFQIKVWQALLNISKGFTKPYIAIGEIINYPKASRAIGTAIGQNPVHYLIPCHRVVRNDGTIGGYAGGIEVKKALLAVEKASNVNHF